MTETERTLLRMNAIEAPVAALKALSADFEQARSMLEIIIETIEQEREAHVAALEATRTHIVLLESELDLCVAEGAQC